MKSKSIDIIMGVYNCERYLNDSIESILNQSYSNLNLIVCDDGSKDKSYSILKEYAIKNNGKIVLLKNKKNMGLNYTLNKCLKYCKSEYIARMDADDICDKSRIEEEIKFLEKNKEYAFVSCNSLLFDENGVWGKLVLIERPLRKDFALVNPFCHASVMIRKKVLDEVEGYTVAKNLIRVEDYHLWFKLYQKGYLGYNIQQFLYSIRDDRSASNRRNWQNRKNEFYVKRLGFKMLKLPFYYQIFALRPIVLGLLPQPIYSLLHKIKLKKGE